jgi:hypothetical protein
LEILREARARELNALLGDSWMPSRPLWVLTLLQSLESEAEGALRSSSFGSHYAYLIGRMMTLAGIVPNEHPEVLNYLTELAQTMFERDSPGLSSLDVQQFELNFSQAFDPRLPFALLRRNLAIAGILRESAGELRFHQPYMRLFFIARYLALRLARSAKAKEALTRLVRHLHLKDCADVVMFVVHHSDDPAVARLVVAEADRILATQQPLALESEATPRADAPPGEPCVELRNLRRKEVRVQILRDRDAAEHSVCTQCNPCLEERDLCEPGEVASTVALELVGVLSHSLRVLAILGQFLRTYQGSLLAEDKLLIAARCHALVARLLGALHHQVLADTEGSTQCEARSPGLIALCLKRLGRNLPREWQAGATARSACFSYLVFAILQRASELLGSERLWDTHRRATEGSGSVLHELIALAIELGHPNPGAGGLTCLPVKQIGRLVRIVQRIPTGHLVLRLLVRDHLEMFTSSPREERRICKQLNIAIGRAAGSAASA